MSHVMNLAPQRAAGIGARPVKTPLASRPSALRRAQVLLPRRERLVVRVAHEEVISGEWPVNWSLASYEDLGDFFKARIFASDVDPSDALSQIMSREVKTVTPDTPVADVTSLFAQVSGIPVVRQDGVLVGVVSKKDLSRGGSTVGDIMSSPPIAAKPAAKVADAAVLMLKHKVHRIPIVDESAKCIGIVSRTDIFTALALSTGSVEMLN